jgi:hypothetical protein
MTFSQVTAKTIASQEQRPGAPTVHGWQPVTPVGAVNEHGARFQRAQVPVIWREVMQAAGRFRKSTMVR